MFVIIPREELPAGKNTKPSENHVFSIFTLVNYEGRDQKRASRLHFRALDMRNHRYLRGLIYEISKNPNKNQHLFVESSKSPNEINKIMCYFLLRRLHPQTEHKDHPTQPQEAPSCRKPSL